MNVPRQAFLSLLIVCTISALNAQSTKPAKQAIPKALTVKQVLAIIGKSEVVNQTCGPTKWNGEFWGYYRNWYKDMKLPWSPLPADVEAAFTYRPEPHETQLIEFKGPGFRYQRLSKDDPNMTLDNQAK